MCSTLESWTGNSGCVLELGTGHLPLQREGVTLSPALPQGRRDGTGSSAVTPPAPGKVPQPLWGQLAKNSPFSHEPPSVMLFQCSARIKDGLNKPSPAWGFLPVPDLSSPSGAEQGHPRTAKLSLSCPWSNPSTGQTLWDDFYRSRNTL